MKLLLLLFSSFLKILSRFCFYWEELKGIIITMRMKLLSFLFLEELLFFFFFSWDFDKIVLLLRGFFFFFTLKILLAGINNCYSFDYSFELLLLLFFWGSFDFALTERNFFFLWRLIDRSFSAKREKGEEKKKNGSFFSMEIAKITK